jgi:hypothetical protein
LDENIVHHAIKRVDRHDRPDSTAAELLEAIGRICHLVVIHVPEMLGRYHTALMRAREDPPRSPEALYFLKQLAYNSSKRVLEYGELPAAPADFMEPSEDEHIVRAALISHPVIVTADSDLEVAIEEHPHWGLKAMDAHEALEFAKSESP